LKWQRFEGVEVPGQVYSHIPLLSCLGFSANARSLLKSERRIEAAINEFFGTKTEGSDKAVVKGFEVNPLCQNYPMPVQKIDFANMGCREKCFGTFS